MSFLGSHVFLVQRTSHYVHSFRNSDRILHSTIDFLNSYGVFYDIRGIFCDNELCIQLNALILYLGVELNITKVLKLLFFASTLINQQASLKFHLLLFLNHQIYTRDENNITYVDLWRLKTIEYFVKDNLMSCFFKSCHIIIILAFLLE